MNHCHWNESESILTIINGEKDEEEGSLPLRDNSVTGNTSSHIITFDIPDSCYFSSTMYQYNSKFYAGLFDGSGTCPSFIFEVDIVANTSTLIATIQKDDASPFDSYIYFVFDNVNGYLALVATNALDYKKLDICMMDNNNNDIYWMESHTSPYTPLCYYVKYAQLDMIKLFLQTATNQEMSSEMTNSAILTSDLASHNRIIYQKPW
ncbi:hypothetical protein DFA_07796 [Cavenderia fasciculata]|uniref:Uncharacterized protein n=1 Tax=Cavenderia fasciculata TaxID=261658 RepID=F4Q3E9_CACFS|nr:uncharacterized protein DFA_07796 [Cavenderia fasciculata]EGG16818.1 hypothetical protein DFA_07796 [Cavenderia fasciculata]|eukprot:XP_004355292.1 hypothetical protein DFA_07796 [Cavenderia fasciculata]